MRALGYYQIAGGIYGVYAAIQLFIQESTLGGLTMLLYIFGFSLFGFSIYCGNLLRVANIKGINLSLWNQIIQVLQFSISSIAFGYFSGIRFSFGFDWSDRFIPDFALSLSGFSVGYNTNATTDFLLMINGFPLIIIYLLDKLEDKIEQRKKLIEPDVGKELNS